jgi:hypothetical protein
MSINPRLRYADNRGACPCLPPLVLGQYLNRISGQPAQDLRSRVVQALQNLRRKLAN